MRQYLNFNLVNWDQVCNMISYTRGAEALQSVKVCLNRLWNTLKTMFLHVKLQRLCKSHHLQCITSTKDSEKLEKSLCVRDKAEDLCLIPVVFRPSDDTAWHRHDSVIDMTKWAQEYFQKPLPVNTIRRAICRCQLKLYNPKRKPHVNMVQKHRRVLWGQGSFKMDCFKVEKCSMVRRVPIWHSCWKSQMPCPLG